MQSGLSVSSIRPPALDPQRVVNFFIVGVQKGGTSAVDEYLRSSPHVQMARVKEVHFFDDENVDWNDPDYRVLHDHFSWKRTSARCRGEATPIYSYWPDALERLKRHNPRAKLILCLRHPAFRAHSHWRMEIQRGGDQLSFEEAIAEAGRHRVRASPGGVHRVYSYVERGFYAAQVSRLKRLFPPDQLLFLRTDELWREPRQVMKRVHAFLAVTPPGAVERSYVTPFDTLHRAGIPKKSLLALSALFADDIKETAKLTGLDLDDWLSPDYRDISDPASSHLMESCDLKVVRVSVRSHERELRSL